MRNDMRRERPEPHQDRRRKRRLPLFFLKLLLFAVILLFLPNILHGLRQLLPDVTGRTEREAVVLKQYLKDSKRLETLTVDEEGRIETSTNVVLLGTIGSKKIQYRYTASVGIDLTAVDVTAEGDTIIFTLPDPVILNDSIEPIKIEKNDFWSHAVDKKTESILEEEKTACRERYLTEDKYRQRIREATHRAFEETIITWMDINRENTLEYIILDQTPPLSGTGASGEDQKE